MYKIKKTNNIILISLLLLTTFGFLIISYYYKEKINKYNDSIIKNKKLAYKYFPRFIKDQNILVNLNFLNMTSYKDGKGKDAADFLNDKISWEPKRPFKYKTVVPKKYIEQLNKLKFKNSFTEVTDKIDLSTLNFDWMTSLHKFSYWNPEKSKYFRSFLKKNPFTISVPSINFSELLDIYRLRYIKGAQDGKFKQALIDNRKLAELIFSQDSTIAKLIALSIIRTEKEFLKHYAKSDKSILSNWKPIKELNIKRAERVVNYLLAVSMSRHDSLITTELFKNNKLKFFPCFAIKNNISELVRLMSIGLKKSDDFIYIDGKNIVFYNKVINSNPKCELGHLKTRWFQLQKYDKTYAKIISNNHTIFNIPSIYLKIPFLRKYIFLKMISFISKHRLLEIYEES